MAPGCLTPGEINRTVHTAGKDFVDGQQSDAVLSAQQRLIDTLYREFNLERTPTLEAINNAIPEGEHSPLPPTTQETNQLRRCATSLLATREAAERGADRIAQDLENMQAAIGNSEVHQQSWLSRWSAAMSSKFLGGVGKVSLLEQSFFSRGKQRLATDNILTNALNGYQALKQGSRNVLRGHVNEFLNNPLLAKAADRAGITREEMAKVTGNLSIYQHMPERNDLLLSRWQQEYDAIANKEKPTRAEVQTATVLDRQIRNLREHLDDPEVHVNEDTGYRTVLSGGYTNGEARRLWTETIQKYGLTNEEALSLTQALRDMHGKIRDYGAEVGVIAPELIDSLPDWQNYVIVKPTSELFAAPTSDATILSPGSFYAAEGMNALPADAFTSTIRFGERIASNAANQHVGNAMLALRIRQEEIRATDKSFPELIKDYSLRDIHSALRSSDPAIRNKAKRIYESADGGGIIAQVPVMRQDGSVVNEQHLLQFDPNWIDTTNNTRLTGADLNRQLAWVDKFGESSQNVVLGTMQHITSLRAQLVTRYSPTFAFINCLRDIQERALNMGGRSFELENGGVVNGASLMGSYAANTGWAAGILLRSLSRSQPLEGKSGQYYQEYIRNGLNYNPTQGLLPKERGLVKNGKLNGFMMRLAESTTVGRGIKKVLGESGEYLLNKIDGWNDFYNNIAPLSYYLTLREAGVSEAKASSATLEIMNLYQSGTATGLLSAFFPFIRPMTQATAAYARTLGLAPRADGSFAVNARGAATLTGAAVAYGMLMPLFREMMGTDEEGNSRFDQEPIENLIKWTPLQLFGDGDTYIKLHHGMGPGQLAAAIPLTLDRWHRGLMSGPDAAFTLFTTIARNVTPEDWPSYSASRDPVAWLAQSFSPSLIRPAVDVAVNRNFMGNTIASENRDPSVARAIQGRLSTPENYKKWARFALATTGIDLAPEQWRTIIQGYANGPLRYFTEMINDDNLNRVGLDSNIRQELGPMLTALGASSLMGKQADPEIVQFYDRLDRLNAQLRAAGLNLPSASNGKKGEERRALQFAYLQNSEELGWDDDKINAFLDLRQAYQDLLKLSTRFGKQYRSNSDWLDDSEDSIKAIFEGYNTQRLEIMKKALDQFFTTYGSGAV